MTAPSPSTPSAGIPFVTDAVRLARALFSPSKVFEEIQDRPTFWRPFAVVSLISAALGYLQAPFQARVQQLMLEHLNRPVPPASMVKTLLSLAIGTPLTILVCCAIMGGLLYVMVSMSGGQTSYKKMLAVMIFAWPVFVIQSAATVGVLMARGVGSINGAQDMMVSLGVEMLLPSDMQMGWFPRLFLAGLGPLLFWSMTIKAMGLKQLAKVESGAAWTIAAIYQFIALALLSAIGAFGLKMAGA